jgi:chromate transporter
MNPPSLLNIFAIFLQLGLTSFGGPIAHLGYFRREFVARQKWLDEAAYADLVALCQFLPGPASSQVGFALGVSRRGWLGGMAAWLGFTLPSALLLFLFARLETSFQNPIAAATLHGLKLVAVAVVMQAVWSMAKTLTPDLVRIIIAALAIGLVSFIPIWGQIGAIAMGAIAGALICRANPQPSATELSLYQTRTQGFVCLAAFLLLLALLPVLADTLQSQGLKVFAAFYHAGALVFGGGHVVLPLLRDTVVKPGWISENNFLAGYGAAQAVPGPLFTVSAYLGAVLKPFPNGAWGSLIALIGIFLPGILILMGTLPFWHSLRRETKVQASVAGVNAAVVGILAAALYDPLWKSSVMSWRDALLAIAGFLLLVFLKAPSWLIVIGLTALSVAAFFLLGSA